MQNPTGRILKIIFTSILVFITILCLGLFIYRIAIWRDYKVCYSRLSKEYNVKATYSAIGEEMLTFIQKEISSDTNHDEILLILSKIAPIVVHKQISLPNGEIKEMIFLNTCNFTDNGFDYFIISLSDGTVTNIWLYKGD